MSNGVEVIVATDKSARPLEPEFLRFLSSTVTRPITLAPHTLTNLMSMVLSSEQVTDDHNRFMAFLQPTFTTKTYYTTYNYKTTAVKNHSTIVTDARTVVTNVRTEPRCKVTENGGIEPSQTVSVSLSASPTLKTEIFQTEYTYLNKFLDADEPIVLSSTHQISNTMIGTNENLNDLEPSEVFPTTNTYLKTVELTKTLTDGLDHHVISTSDVVTQVVVVDRPTKTSAQIPITTNVTKTYFVTYTYFSTYIEGDKTKVKSDVSVSSDVTIEKFYIKPKKTETVTFEKVTKTTNPLKATTMVFPFNVMATRTYLTTFTYFTTLVHGTDRKSPETKINSRTKIVENTVAERIPHQDFNTEYLIRLNSSLQRISGSVVGTATLRKGETLLVTAYRSSPLKSSYQKYEIKPTKSAEHDQFETKWTKIQGVENSFKKIKPTISSEQFSVTRTQAAEVRPTKSAVGNRPTAEALIGNDVKRSATVQVAATMSTPPLSSVAHKEHHSGGQQLDSLMASSNVDEESVTSALSGAENAEKPDTSASVPGPTEKNPKPGQYSNQTNGLLNFNSFGINGMNVLGPVFNAMAEIINNKIHKNGEGISRRNSTATEKVEQIHREPSSSNVNPILNFVNKFTLGPAKATAEPKTKSTTPRTPVYIPVGSFGEEMEGSESQNRRVLIANGQENWYEKWKDIHGKNSEKVKINDNPVTILEGGIPISPGEVITTNSDVIIGRPGESGPRPPNFAYKNEVPVDMRPPPVPPSIAPVGDGDHYVGQPSNNQGVNFHFVKGELDLSPPSAVPFPKKPTHGAQPHKVVRPYLNGHKDHKGGPQIHHHKNSHVKYDSGTLDLNPPPVPPPSIRTHDVHRPITVNHKPVHESHVLDHLHREHDHDHDHDHNHDHKNEVNSMSLKLDENYLSSSDVVPSVLTLPTIAALNPLHPGSITLISTPTPNLDSNVGSVVLVPTVADISINPNALDRSTGHPFLVNIQPSQVANIVIPHGSSTALIVSDGKQHSLKGEVIDDPSPHPEPETVGFVGAEPVLKLENDEITSALQNEVIPAETIEAPKTSSQLNGILLSNQPQLGTGILSVYQKPFGDVQLPNQQFSIAHNPLANAGQFVQTLPLLPPSLPSAVPQESTTLNHHQQAPQGQNTGGETQILQNHVLEGQNGSVVASVGQNLNLNVHNFGKGIIGPGVSQNYRKEPNANGGNVGPLLYENGQTVLDAPNLFGSGHFQQIQSNQGSQNNPFTSDNLYSDQIRFKQGQKLENGGVYVGVPPPSPLPQVPDGNQHRDVHQSTLKENFANHQSGIVHDVPISQVLEGADLKKENHPLKDILIKHLTPGDSISYDPKLGGQVFEGPNLLKRPANDFDQDLSPPPPPHRPPFVSLHQGVTLQKAPQRYRPHSHPPVPTPLDFMIPPPETPNRQKLKPQVDQSSRPVIPIGAMGHTPTPNYPLTRPEDMVIVPHKNRPGFVEPAFVNAIKHKHQIPANSPVYYDLDVSDTSGSVHMEKGEEMQESVSQPMYPGQVINDVIHINKNYTHSPLNYYNNRPSRPSTFGVFTHNKTTGGNHFESSTEFKNHNLGAVSNVSQQGPPHNRNTGAKPSHKNTGSDIKDSSSHESSNTAHIVSPGHNHNLHEGLKQHQNHYHGHHSNHREPSSTYKQQEQAAATFDSMKISSGGRRPAGSGGFSANGPSGFQTHRQSNTTRNGTVVRVPKPNLHPPGFAQNENSGGSRPISSITNHGDLQKSESTQSIHTAQTGSVKVPKDPVGYPSTQIETISSDTFFGQKDKTSDPAENHNLRPNIVGTTPSRNKQNEIRKEPENSQVFGDSIPNPKQPIHPGTGSNQVYGSPIQVYGSKIKPGSAHNLSRPSLGVGNVPNRPTKNPTASVPPAKDNRNKIILGHSPAGNNHNVATGPQKRPYLPFDSLGQGSVTRPSGFRLPPKEEASKVPEDGTNNKQATNFKKEANDGGYIKQTTASGSLPLDHSPTNQSASLHINVGHKYGNKTVNFYDSKPAFDVTEVHKTYNNAALETDKWFASTFNNNNHKHNYNNTISDPTNKLTSGGNYKNATQSKPSSPIGSDSQITMLTPPKATENKPKVDEVMGLSPPPLERPRRPQASHRPQRPKPHHKFDGPSSAKPPMAPIAIENDFPPVRSPEFNRKPFKPQDIFPPRLPDNFVHHLPDYPPRLPPKQRPSEKPITSLPIDVPTTGKPDKPFHSYDSSYELDEDAGEDDPYFAGSEINGHSKPIYDDGPVILKKPPSAIHESNNQKPVLPSKSYSTHQETLKIETSGRVEHDTTVKQIPPISTKSFVRDDISPTPTMSASTSKAHPSKTSTPLAPTATEPYKEWQDTEIITGSEMALEPNQFNNHVTPDISSVFQKNQVVTTFVTTGSTTIFGNQITQSPSQSSKSRPKSTVAMEADESDEEAQTTSTSQAPNITPTRTTTLTVTTTMTTVVHSIGNKPFTTTIVLTKTLISTVFNKITETKTLVKPTTSTLYQTHTVSTTKTSLVIPTALHPSSTKHQPGGTLKPEIFVADPHAKDTMTISVSSSLNKNSHKKGEQKVQSVDGSLDQTGKGSIMVVVSNDHPHDDLSDEDKVEASDEENEVIHSRVMVGGVFDAEVDKEFQESSNKEDECFPGCKAKKNELCQRIKGVMKCVCRPGFARMFPDRPCRPTYTYEVKLALEKFGPEHIQYEKSVAQSNSANMAKLASVTKEGLDRMIMQSELRDVYHGVVVNGFQGKEKKTTVDFYVQLSENTDEEKLVKIFKETLQSSNYSLGGTELFAAREADNLDAEDFNECLSPKYHDCSEHARCFNLKGTYTCSCKEGYTDMSENTLFPGRICSDAIGCEYCGYHGACYSKGEGQITCECFQWYSGERCNINLKVLLIALATIGVILLALLLVCGVLTCLNRRNKNSSSSRNNGYLRYRGPSSHSIDRRAMISDSSSESSVDNLPYLSSPPMPKAEAMNAKKKPVLRHVKGPVPRPLPPPGMEQRDRSVTVMIPRAKYRPPPHLSPHLTMSTFSPEKHLPKPVGQIATEQKLISYLDGNTREERTIVNKNQNNRQESDNKTYDFKITSVANANESSRHGCMDIKKDPRVFEYEYKISNMSFSEETNSAERRSGKGGDDRFRRHSDSTHLHTDSNRAMQFRKYSAGALVSAGYEVSAKVGMHQLDDDIIDDDQSAITNTHTMKSNRSQFTTLNRTGDHKTMSEARSYDETTVHPQTRSLKTNYSGSSPSLRANNDEGHTMIERDLGSTFIMPESQLFKPEADRGSDISNFDSL